MSSAPSQARDQEYREPNKKAVNYRVKNLPGASFPPYPLTGEAWVQFSIEQQEAGRIRDHLIERHNMEIDKFGLARFREDLRQAGYQIQVDRPDRNTQRTPVRPTYSSSEVAPAVAFDGEDVQLGEIESTSQQQYSPGSENIISEDNPEFRDVALRLKALRVATGIAPAPSSQSTKLFRPSHMALEKMGYIEPREGSRYQGHKSKDDRTFIPDSLNCGLWISCLDPRTTITEIFDAIQTGAVFSLSLTPAQKGYPTAAAGLYFMTHSGAEQFLAQVNSAQGVWIHGARIKAIYNKHGALQQSDLSRSRVLRVQGPDEEMTREFWENFWAKWIQFQLSHVERVQLNGGQAEIYFAFSRIDGQACSAKMAFGRQREFVGLFQCEYAKDPCNPW